MRTRVVPGPTQEGCFLFFFLSTISTAGALEWGRAYVANRSFFGVNVQAAS